MPGVRVRIVRPVLLRRNGAGKVDNTRRARYASEAVGRQCDGSLKVCGHSHMEVTL